MGLDFVEKAPCRNADPWLFDQSEIDLALPGLQYCKVCPFWQDCDDLVAPAKSHYEGIAAGKVWRNGRVLAKLDASSPNRLTVGEDFYAETVELRGSELLGDRHGDVLPRGPQLFT